ncbi:pyrroline-5-carboxylate reductase family protein [Sphingomonas baiyangensis]|uniref:Pyrroline-5-carboxylate reductase n=1 Tax=Sphingomonas baiyangensis TaxID=2572576 RepID=A0A4U1L759_9SPHN|nr:pyrroline-5-carboxylate reductase dimerization domain-containing protein [Sphingomonas baiyangensis]TKD52243.1 pyrroline-5-carboxylate reductase [Sphingomonas baiyangensis]
MVGAGNMGGAMLRRWIDAGTLARDEVLVLNKSGRTVIDGVESRTGAPDAPLPDMVMLGIKPQMIDAAPAFLRDRDAPVPLLISILAGVDMATLADRFAAHSIVRAMPNLPVAIGKGVVALHGSRAGDVDALMQPLGLVERIEDEAQFDLVTALAGSGPGFTYRFIDAMAAGAAALGLPADQALRLARATVYGSASLAADADVSPATLADRVASPGGSTREGLNVLDADDALATLLTRTLDAATRRNAAMAAEARR